MSEKKRNMKFHVRDAEQSKLIQEILFSAGWEWWDGGSDTAKNTDSGYLFAYADGSISHSRYLSAYDNSWFQEASLLGTNIIMAGGVVAYSLPATPQEVVEAPPYRSRVEAYKERLTEVVKGILYHVERGERIGRELEDEYSHLSNWLDCEYRNKA